MAWTINACWQCPCPGRSSGWVAVATLPICRSQIFSKHSTEQQPQHEISLKITPQETHCRPIQPAPAFGVLDTRGSQNHWSAECAKFRHHFVPSSPLWCRFWFYVKVTKKKKKKKNPPWLQYPDPSSRSHTTAASINLTLVSRAGYCAQHQLDTANVLSCPQTYEKKKTGGVQTYLQNWAHHFCRWASNLFAELVECLKIGLWFSNKRERERERERKRKREGGKERERERERKWAAWTKSTPCTDTRVWLRSWPCLFRVQWRTHACACHTSLRMPQKARSCLTKRSDQQTITATAWPNCVDGCAQAPTLYSVLRMISMCNSSRSCSEMHSWKKRAAM